MSNPYLRHRLTLLLRVWGRELRRAWRRQARRRRLRHWHPDLVSRIANARRGEPIHVSGGVMAIYDADFDHSSVAVGYAATSRPPRRIISVADHKAL